MEEAHAKICRYSHATRGNVDVAFEVAGSLRPGPLKATLQSSPVIGWDRLLSPRSQFAKCLTSRRSVAGTCNHRELTSSRTDLSLDTVSKCVSAIPGNVTARTYEP